MKIFFSFILSLCLLLVACSKQEVSQSLLQQPALYLPGTTAQVVGNPKGSITVVEFFDYRCSACKAAFPALQQLVSMSPRVRVVYREIPILGSDSVFAARAAIASIAIGRYRVFHDALINSGPLLDPQSVLTIAARLSIDPDFLIQHMNSPQVTDLLSQNLAFAKALRLDGTPAYAIARTTWVGGRLKVEKALLVRGAMTLAMLEAAIKQVGKP